ncbi:MAG: spore coat associated protein CotJA [Ruminococcus sp.]|nr:spore coat associated protein CotJA [Ruminococcus sp.]
MEIFDKDLLAKIIRNDGRVPDDATCANCAQPYGAFPVDMPIGMCYVPMQNWGMLYDEDKGLDRGTIFRELDKPFTGERSVLFND